MFQNTTITFRFLFTGCYYLKLSSFEPAHDFWANASLESNYMKNKFSLDKPTVQIQEREEG